MAEKACHGFGSTTQVGLTQALGTTKMDLSATDLHDATLLGLHLDWQARSCRIDFAGMPSHQEPFSLVFLGVTELVVPAKDSWGPSSSVLSAKQLSGGGLVIEMQSGDTITVVVPNNSFKPNPLRSGNGVAG